MISYLNTKLNNITETIAQLDSQDFRTSKGFRVERMRLLNGYNLAGVHGDPYWSQRACK